MIYTENEGFFRTKFTLKDIYEKYKDIDKVTLYLYIKNEIEKGSGNQFTLEPDVDIWFPINYFYIWEC